MKIPVDITIETKKQIDSLDGNNSKESRQTTATGYLMSTRSGLSLQFCEKSEEDNVTTLVNLIDNKLMVLSREGEANMVFEMGKTHRCIYNNGMLPMELRIYTKYLNSTLSNQGGKVDVDYTIDIIANRAEQSHLTFSVTPAENKFTS